MPKPGSQSCASCQYFEVKATTAATTGWCVRYPPWVIAGSRDAGDWPVTQADWWCGEWKQAVQE